MDDQGYVARYSPAQGRVFKERRPLLSHLDVELTERCNNACIHCYINLPADDQASARELATGEWKDNLRQAADLGALSVRFTGGEPLLREDFPDLYLFTRRLGMKVVLFTNARFITPEFADIFAKVPLLQKIEITVYGMRPESYDTVACAPGAYAEFRRGVDLLWKNQIPFVVKAALLPPNKAEMAESEAWAAKIPGMCEQCPGKSWAEHGTLDTPVDYLCQVAHAQARYLGLIADGERAWEVGDGQNRVARLADR